MKTIFYYATAIGKIGIAASSEAITDVCFEGEIIPEDAIAQESALLRQAVQQLQQYFAGERKTFTLPLAPSGTPFRQRVWQALQKIPYGETRTYKEIAVCIGNEKAARAVGQANNRNPIPILIPCHRVIGASGELVGYGGGMAIKEYLLKLEQQ